MLLHGFVQTFIHVTGVVYAFSLSTEPAFWTVGLLWNAYAIHYIWFQDPERNEPPYVFESNFKVLVPRNSRGRDLLCTHVFEL